MMFTAFNKNRRYILLWATMEDVSKSKLVFSILKTGCFLLFGVVCKRLQWNLSEHCQACIVIFLTIQLRLFFRLNRLILSVPHLCWQNPTVSLWISLPLICVTQVLWSSYLLSFTFVCLESVPAALDPEAFSRRVSVELLSLIHRINTHRPTPIIGRFVKVIHTEINSLKSIRVIMFSCLVNEENADDLICNNGVMYHCLDEFMNELTQRNIYTNTNI